MFKIACALEGLTNLPNNNSVNGFLLASYSFISQSLIQRCTNGIHVLDQLPKINYYVPGLGYG